jgi:6-phosphogluconate dehydrogenase
MKDGLGMTHQEMGDVFAQWNKGVLDSFLIEITKDIVRFGNECLRFSLIKPDVLQR